MILIINCGSSSIKFDVFYQDLTAKALSGSIDYINDTTSTCRYNYNDTTCKEIVQNCNYDTALETINSLLKEKHITKNITAIGHRVVHGGEKFKKSCVINDSVIKAIKNLSALAPLHNPVNLLGIEYFFLHFPQAIHVATFDTAFHQTMLKNRYLYALPYKLYTDLMLRKYGMHGISYNYVNKKAANILNIDKSGASFLVAHLGNGSSVCVIKNGVSVDTTMGMTPLAGLMMGTRCGDIDPGIFQFLADQNNMSTKEITNMLNNESGMLGVSQLSNDCRDLEDARQSNNMAELALEMFAYIVAKNIAALSVNLEKIDALIFCGGIGENSSFLRKKIISQLRILNFNLDEQANNTIIRGKEGFISTKKSNAVIVIPTDESLMIATDTLHLLNTVFWSNKTGHFIER